MFCAVGLDVGMRRDEVLQTWLSENADVGSQMVLYSEAEGGGELPRGTDGSLVADFILTMYVIVGVQGCIDRYFRHQTSAAVKIPCPTTIYVEHSFHRDAKIVYHLPVLYLVAVLAHLKLRSEFAVVQAGFNPPTMIQSVFKGQRPCDWHLVMACS